MFENDLIACIRNIAPRPIKSKHFSLILGDFHTPYKLNIGASFRIIQNRPGFLP